MNTEEIRIAMVRKNLTAVETAKKIGMTPSSFSNKIHGKTEFTIGEVVKLSDALDLTNKQRLNIFFG